MNPREVMEGISAFVNSKTLYLAKTVSCTGNLKRDLGLVL